MNENVLKTKYIIELVDFNVADDTRNAIINDETVVIDSHLFNSMMIALAKKVYDGGAKAEDAVEYLCAEESKLGFYEKYGIDEADWKKILLLSFNELNLTSNPTEKAEKLIAMLETVTDKTVEVCSSITVLEHLVGMGTVGVNLELSKKLIEKLDGVDVDEVHGMIVARRVMTMFINPLGAMHLQ